LEPRKPFANRAGLRYDKQANRKETLEPMSRITTTTTPLAVSADYADALITARRAKNWLFLFLLIGLLAQIAIFFCAKFNVLKITPEGAATVTMPKHVESSTSSSTGPTTAESTTTIRFEKEEKALEVRGKNVTGDVVAWVVNSIVYLAAIFSIVMSIIVLLLVLIMLVGRLIGVAHTTSAFVWAALLAVLIFPWQLFYSPETARAAMTPTDAKEIRLDDYRWPGALYTYGELRQGASFKDAETKVAVLRYARFVGFPFVALVILFMAQAKSGRGVKYALGEAEVHVDVTTNEA
jgi:hypothetical protein